MLEKITRWSSTLLVLSGILVALPMLFQPDVEQPGFALQRSWVPVHIFFGIAALLSIAGLGALYRALGSRVSVIGHAAFVLALLGNVLLAGLMFFVEATIIPVLAGNSEYEVLMSITGPLLGGAFGTFVMLSYAITSVGALLLAVYLASTKTISLLNAALFLGAPLAGFVPPFPTVLGISGGVIFGVALIWLGISIRRGIAHEALAAGLGAHDDCFLEAGGHA